MARWGKRWLRPARTLKAGLLLLALSAVVSVVLAGVASAAPEPPPPAPSPTAPPPSLQEPESPLNPKPPVQAPAPGTADPMDSDLIQGVTQEQQKKAKEARAAFDKRVADYKKQRAAQDGILGSFGVTDRDGNPVTSYRIYADTGDWTDWDLSIAHFLVEMFYLGSKWGVCFACFLLSWSLAFSLAGLLLKPALQISTSLYGGVVVHIGLPGLFLTVALVTAAWQLMFGNRVRGWGEMAAALVISALALGALASPPQLLLSKDTGAIAVVRDLALETAALILDKEAIETNRPTTDAEWERTAAGGTVGTQVRTASSALARPITDALVDAFVARPAMLLSYGRTFEGECGTSFRNSRIEQAVLDQSIDQALKKATQSDTDALKDVPFIGDALSGAYDAATGVPKKALREMVTAKGPIADFEKKCLKEADKSASKASIDKVGGAFFMFLATLLVCLFIVVLDCAFLFGQVQLALEALLAKVALAIGVLPGPGRCWLWDRAQAIARGLLLILASITSLAVLIVVVNAILNTPEADLPGGLTVRFIALDILCIAAFVYRKRLARSTRRMTLRARRRLGASPLGGAATSPTALHAPRKRGGLGRGLLVGGLMLGALAASGGTGAVLGGGRLAGGKLAGRLGGAAVRGTGRAVGTVADAAGRTVAAAAKGAGKTGLFGLKATVGLPVYGPRAARSVHAAATALPGRVATRTRSAAHTLHQQAQTARIAAAPAQAFVGEYTHNLRSLGRTVTGRGGLGRYTPPRPPAPVRVPRPAPRPATPTAPTPPSPQVPPAPAPVPRRPAPPRVVTAPASAAQALLQRRLHRAQTPRTPTPGAPGTPAPRVRRTPPTPRPGLTRRRRP